MKKINIGLIGFGTIGTGVVKLMKRNSALIGHKTGSRLNIKKIVDLDITTDRGVKVKDGVLTTDVNDILNDPEISIVIELIGGYKPAKDFILKAMKKGKHIVTANKALLAVHGDEIFGAARKNGVNVGFEASVCGGIPIIRTIKEGLCAEKVASIYGIFNGTCNYILTKMTEEGKAFSDVLDRAKQLGYAEADPTFDIEGIDAAHKLAILTALSFGTKVNFKDVYTEGIARIAPIDIDFASSLGYRIKLIAMAKSDGKSIQARVHPTMLKADHPLATVNDVFNAVYVNADATGPTMYYGKGAGMMPTASAVMSDVIEIARGIDKGVSGRVPLLSFKDEHVKTIPIKPIGDTVNKYYMRMTVKDRPKVLSKISGILGDNNISIESVIQKGKPASKNMPIVLQTHHALDSSVKKALKEIDALSFVIRKTVYIRIEDKLD
jgi:homoserine dehydrogenase